MNPVNLIAFVLGFGAGLLATKLAIRASKWLGDGGFWHKLAAVTRLLISPSEETSFLQEYLRLWPMLIAFIGRQFAVGLIAVTPVAFAFGCAALIAHGLDDSYRGADLNLAFGASVLVAAIACLLLAKYRP